MTTNVDISLFLDALADSLAERIAKKLGEAPSSTGLQPVRTEAQLLTINETAARLRVSPRTVARLLQLGQIARVSIGGATRIRVADVESYQSRDSPAVPEVDPADSVVVSFLSERPKKGKRR